MELSPELQKVYDGLKDTFESDYEVTEQYRGDTIIRVKPDHIVDICNYLKEKHHFVYLADIFGTDRFTSDDRFEVIYNIVSLKTQQRLFLKTRCEEENPHLNSVTSVWPAANWFERETYDMFGIVFENHPDLRRMFMPEDFDYHPLRKEFPLLGIPGSIELPSSTPDTE